MFLFLAFLDKCKKDSITQKISKQSQEIVTRTSVCISQEPHVFLIASVTANVILLAVVIVGVRVHCKPKEDKVVTQANDNEAMIPKNN